jgi:predicted acetyltransferase
MRERGEVISSLFPATSRLYRRLGWELAGACAWRSLAPASLGALPRAGQARVRPLEERDFEAVRGCYERMAAPTNGFLERGERGWRAHRERWRRRSTFVAEDADGGVAGWLVYRQLDGEYSALGGPFQLAVDDVGWTTREAGLALWHLIGSWATQTDRVIYRSGPEDPLLLLAPEQELRTLAEVRWMTRVVDVAGAVAARGFPAGLSLAVSFELEDEILPENSGVWRLLVEGGRGALERGGAGGARLDVGAFSSLYTGWSTSAGLARAGRLVGGSAEERARLDAAFTGPTPWMLDEF